jgi:hypothetical protein
MSNVLSEEKKKQVIALELFAKSTCPVRTHQHRRIFNKLARCHLRQKTSFASICAPTVHQSLAPIPQR